MTYRALLAILATALLVASAGCHALGFTGGSGIPGTYLGTVPTSATPQTAAGLSVPAASALLVAPWAIAVTLSAVVVAFVVKLLRNRVLTPGV